MKMHLITFGDGSLRWRSAAWRLVREANASNWFATARSFNLQRLLSEVGPESGDLAAYANAEPRGFGYWLWKPQLIRHALSTLPSGSVLVYLDAGCQLNVNERATDRLADYSRIAQESGVFAMRTGLTLSSWCKADLMDRLNLSEAQGEKKLLEPGVLFLTRTPGSMMFVQRWLDLAREESHHYLDDSPSRIANSPHFVEHRHDQAIFSCLYVADGLQDLPLETYFPNRWSTSGRNFPIWAARNCYPLPIVGSSISARMFLRARRMRRLLKSSNS